MGRLHTALTASETSNVFEVHEVGDFTVALTPDGSGFNAGTITMQISTDDGASWDTFTSGGSNVTFTAAAHRTFTYGGAQFRFSADGSISDVDIDVSGTFVTGAEEASL